MNPKMDSPSLFLNLPSEITTDILLRLPIRDVATCKCVCTKWLKLTASPEFAKHHLLKSSPGLIVTLNGQPSGRIIEFDDVPLHYKPLMEFNLNIVSSGCCIECSVDGLLCLREPDYDDKVDTLYICNPVTQEYIHLPGLKGNVPGYPNTVTYGIGISALTCQYKVVRIFHEPVSGGESRLKHLKLECMIYTLGTGSWRNVEPNMVFEYSIRRSNAAFLNGNLHWAVEDDKQSPLISCLDLDTEMFKPFPPPSTISNLLASSLTVVGGCLCICDYGDDDKIDIWIMKEYGVEESWAKEYVINKWPDLGGISYEEVYFLHLFKDGEILMLWQGMMLFYHCQKTDTNPQLYPFAQDPNPDFASGIDALLYTPSFVSLRRFAGEIVLSAL